MVRVTDVDRYGRLVGRIGRDGVDASVALVQAGSACHYVRYSDDTVLAQGELAALQEARGLWSQADPVASWLFRRGTGTR